MIVNCIYLYVMHASIYCNELKFPSTKVALHWLKITFHDTRGKMQYKGSSICNVCSICMYVQKVRKTRFQAENA